MDRVLDVGTTVPTTPLDPATVVDGSPHAGSRALAAVAGVEVGVWEMTPGTATDVEVDEVFVVLSGAATVSFDDGEQVDLGPGSVVRLRAGEQTTWVVRETLRKIYVA
ncbi:cupin domain-containing protein [Alloalcanivorax gelatiniphagus]